MISRKGGRTLTNCLATHSGTFDSTHDIQYHVTAEAALRLG